MIFGYCINFISFFQARFPPTAPCATTVINRLSTWLSQQPTMARLLILQLCPCKCRCAISITIGPCSRIMSTSKSKSLDEIIYSFSNLTMPECKRFPYPFSIFDTKFKCNIKLYKIILQKN